jgi:hypothetical protein
MTPIKFFEGAKKQPFFDPFFDPFLTPKNDPKNDPVLINDFIVAFVTRLLCCHISCHIHSFYKLITATRVVKTALFFYLGFSHLISAARTLNSVTLHITHSKFSLIDSKMNLHHQ